MRLYYRFLQALCQIFFIGYLHGRAFGRHHVPRAGAVVLASNHQSFLDPVLAGLALPRECHFIARDSLFRHPLFRRLIASLNAFPVKRATADLAAMKEGLRRLRDGAALVIFPEGTRTSDGALGALQSGPVLLAKRAGVPIVPVVIAGAYECWPRTRAWPQPGRVFVLYGRGLSVREIAEWSPDQIVMELRARMLRMQAEIRRMKAAAGADAPPAIAMERSS